MTVPHEELVTRDIPEIVEAGAKDGRDWFIAYMREGFTEEQALAMVTRVIVQLNVPERKRWWQR